MSVKRQWKIQKLSALPIEEDVRQQLITDIMRRKSPKISVYAWNVRTNIAEEAFLDQTAAIKDWYIKNRLWEKEDCPKGILLYEWAVSVDELLRHSNKARLISFPLSSAQKIHVGITPSALHEDMQRTLKNQG